MKTKAGMSIALRNEPFYDSSDSTTRSGTLYGVYFVWSDTVENGRIKITTEKSKVGIRGQDLGWIAVAKD